MAEVHRDPADNPNLCLMPRCMRGGFQQGMCEKHYRMAYPDERLMPLIHEHMAHEHAIHPFNMAQAKVRHQRQQQRDQICDEIRADLTPLPPSCEEMSFSVQDWAVFTGEDEG